MTSTGRDLFFRNQRRPVSNNLFNLRPAAGKTGHRRWSGQNQWSNLLRESLDRAAILATHADAQLHFRNIRRGCPASGPCVAFTPTNSVST